MERKTSRRGGAARIEIFGAAATFAEEEAGLRKADLAEHAESRDRGLAWGSGNFRGGRLTVSKKDLAREKNAGPGAAQRGRSSLARTGSGGPGREGAARARRREGGHRAGRRVRNGTRRFAWRLWIAESVIPVS